MTEPLPPLTPGDTQAFSKEFHGASYGMVFRVPKAPRGSEPARENFTGYYLPPGTTKTVQEIMDYYVHGLPSASNSGLNPVELAEGRGYPVSGDGTTKRRHASSFTMNQLPQHVWVITPKGRLF